MVARVTGIHLDAVGGIAGDMFVAALLDALPELRPRVLGDAAAALPTDQPAPTLAEVTSGAIRGLRFGLGDPKGVAGDGDGHEHHHHPHDTAFPSLVRRIRGAALADGTADHAIAILTLIAEVEAAIHRVTIEAVHFHEIGDWDSLLDVVAAGSIAAALEGARWTVSPLPRGGGLVRTRHGMLPVPAPATAALLTGFDWRDDGIGGERVTPTGAAILRHLIGREGSRASLSGRLRAVGTGAGTRSLPGIPNVLRALAFEPSHGEDAAQDGAARETVTVISFEIDDMTGEEIAVAADRLRRVEGVLDLSLSQRFGKKGRPLQSFRLLVRPPAAEAAIARCFLETTTIGLRLHAVERAVLPRRVGHMRTGGATVGIKTVRRSDGSDTVKAESDDLAGDTLQARRHLKQQAEGGGPE